MNNMNDNEVKVYNLKASNIRIRHRFCFLESTKIRIGHWKSPIFVSTILLLSDNIYWYSSTCTSTQSVEKNEDAKLSHLVGKKKKEKKNTLIKSSTCLLCCRNARKDTKLSHLVLVLVNIFAKS